MDDEQEGQIQNGVGGTKYYTVQTRALITVHLQHTEVLDDGTTIEKWRWFVRMEAFDRNYDIPEKTYPDAQAAYNAALVFCSKNPTGKKGWGVVDTNIFRALPAVPKI